MIVSLESVKHKSYEWYETILCQEDNFYHKLELQLMQLIFG